MFQVIRPLTFAERIDRASCWPLYVPRIYWLIRSTGMARRDAWRAATNWFHAWVWNWAELPW